MPMYQLPGYETEEDRVAPPVVAPPALPPAAASPYKLPSSFVSQAGTPGVGVVGPTAYRVGVQKWGPADWQAWSERQAVLESQQQAAALAAQQAQLQERLIREVEAKDAIKAEQMKIQYLAQRQVQQAIASGVPAPQAYLQFPQAFAAIPSGAGAAAFSRSVPPPTFTQPRLVTLPGGPGGKPVPVVEVASGKFQVVKEPTPKDTGPTAGDERSAQAALLAQAQKEEALYAGLLADPNTQDQALKTQFSVGLLKAQDKVRQASKRLNAIRQTPEAAPVPSAEPQPGAAVAPAAVPAGAPPPAAPAKALRKKGTVYMTGSGPARWMGDGWVLEK